MNRRDPEELMSRALAVPGVEAAADILHEMSGGRVAVVGGFVRDLLLGLEPAGDIDLVAEIPVDASGTGALAAVGDLAAVHGAFGTATLSVDGSPVRIDVAASRRESYPVGGALPVVAPAPLEEDLLRRDFGVGAVAVVLRGSLGDPGESLLEAPGALDDIAARRLRVLHDASFRDDPTRLLRLARYAGRLERFVVDDGTAVLAATAVAGGALATVSGPRIGQELRLIAREPTALAGFSWLSRLGIADALVGGIGEDGAAVGAVGPEFDDVGVRFSGGFGVADVSLVARAWRLLPEDGRRDIVVLAAAMAGIRPDAAAAQMDDWGFTAADRDAVRLVLERADKLSMRLEMAGPLSEIDAAVHWFAGEGARPGVLELVAVAGAIHPANAAREWLVELRHRRLAITGSDLLGAGIAAGPAVGVGLAAARAAMLDGDAVDRDAQLEVAVRAARASA